ncbi:MAG: hypothetical protein GYA33_14855, partial [Thermogutta sp.]|nr:hypothetical protein [Thermogutta sp.]
MRALPILVIQLCLLMSAAAVAEEAVGVRPYEMDWAGRTQDDHPALVDFEDLDGWTVDCNDAEASFARTRRQQLWGRFVGTLTYRGTGPQPRVAVRPPQPIALPDDFDCINFWVYGNNWAWVPDPGTPPVEITLVFRTSGDQEVRVSLGTVHWREWWLMHRKLPPEQQAALKTGARLTAIEVTRGRNSEDRELHFDNLSVYREELRPLTFEPRPRRNLTLPADQPVGTNTGPGTLPFPTREETLLPDNLTADFTVDLQQDGEAFVFAYQGSDGRLEYRYLPRTGTLSDISANWEPKQAEAAASPGPRFEFRPMVDGGVVFARDEKGGPAPAAAGEATAGTPSLSAELLSCKRNGDTITAQWRMPCGEHDAVVEYAFRLWQKSLVVDVACRGGRVEQFRFGRAVGLPQPRLVTLPYLTCDEQRPAVVVAGPEDRPVFLFGIMDYYRSNASALWAANGVSREGVVYNGGSRYLPKTDGARNDCFERLFLTVSSRFEEVLPNIPNPRSPWMHVAGERLWIAHGASDRAKDYALWKQLARHGMTKVVITDHETGWRDGGESFTFRTRAAPGKGGDEAQAEYARKVRALGFRYGIYNNYTDFAPVNEFWHEDMVTRLPDGNWQTAWPRCYNPKPARAVEYEARLAPIIQEKFQLDTAYCDVHTAVRPWSYVDYDARVPGAGTFAATFYAYGEIMLHQKRTWNGPVYSEGNNHWYYCGLTDGNYGQDQLAHLSERPWLVDFDLRKLHPLCCNFGMGNPEMFFGKEGLGKTAEDREARLDRFLAATLAFGHTGFLVLHGGMATAARSYFNLQQVHAAYAQAAAKDIRYADEGGKLLDSSAALATGAFTRSQIRTRYSNGLTVTVNGHPEENWAVDGMVLPPNGWLARSDDGDLLAYSALVDGRRADYVDSPAYVYADGRGRFTRFPKAACDGQMIAHKREDGRFEVIPVGACREFAIGLGGRSAEVTALDEEGTEIGSPEIRYSRGLVHILPLPKAFSYVVSPREERPHGLDCPRIQVVPGETVTVRGTQEHAWQVPADAAAGSHLWQSFEDAWIDFDVVPLVDVQLAFDDRCELRLAPRFPAGIGPGVVELNGRQVGPPLEAGKPWHYREPQAWTLDHEEVRDIPLRVTVGPLQFEKTWRCKVERGLVRLPADFQRFTAGECLRGGDERPFQSGSGAHAHLSETSCGGIVRPSLFMHPPYQHGVGYTYAIFDPIELPSRPAAFRCLIGKGDGSDPGDGILFRVAVVEDDGAETVVAERQWIRHAWEPLEGDLSRWTGKRIRIKVIADVGP